VRDDDPTALGRKFNSSTCFSAFGRLKGLLAFLSLFGGITACFDAPNLSLSDNVLIFGSCISILEFDEAGPEF